MSILIKGMDMPKEQITAVINPNGLIEIIDDNNTLVEEHYAIELSPHGDLIDADALYNAPKPIGKLMMYGGEYVYTQTAIDNAPTIIEREDKI